MRTAVTLGDALRAVAAHDLEDAPSIGSPLADWPAFVAAIVEERLTGLALAAVARGTIEVDEAQHAALVAVHEEQMALDLRVERLMVETVRLLADARIELRILKGPALARRVYPDPSWRSFGDCDVLVRAEDLGRVMARLRPLARRRFDAPRSRFDARFVKAVCLETDDGMQIDVHRTLAPGPYGVRIPNARLFTDVPEIVAVGGEPVPCLPRALDAVHACVHAALGDVQPRLNTLRDLAQLFASGAVAEDVAAFAEELRCGAVAQRAVQLVREHLGVELPATFVEWAESYRPTRRDLRELASYRSREGRYPAQAAATFWALPRLRDRVAYATALTLPSRSYLSGRDGGYGRRLARGVRLLARWRPR
jgi:hypothetical protein